MLKFLTTRSPPLWPSYFFHTLHHVSFSFPDHLHGLERFGYIIFFTVLFLACRHEIFGLCQYSGVWCECSCGRGGIGWIDGMHNLNKIERGQCG